VISSRKKRQWRCATQAFIRPLRVHWIFIHKRANSQDEKSSGPASAAKLPVLERFLDEKGMPRGRGPAWQGQKNGGASAPPDFQGKPPSDAQRFTDLLGSIL